MLRQQHVAVAACTVQCMAASPCTSRVLCLAATMMQDLVICAHKTNPAKTKSAVISFGLEIRSVLTCRAWTSTESYREDCVSLNFSFHEPQDASCSSEPQQGTTSHLQLHLLQTVLVPVLQYGCQIWGMHSPHVAAVNYARSDLQRLYDYYLRTICDLLPSTPRKMLLAELGLLPLQVFWWRQTLQFWDSLAALPAGSFYHTVCLDNLTDAFGGGACNMASSLAGCLNSVGYDMPRVCDVIPILDVDNIIEVLTTQLQDLGNGALYCPRVAPTRGVVSCTYEQ